MIKEKIMCLGQISGRCPHCKNDMDPNHHPNNKDCRNYKEVKMLIVDAIDANWPNKQHIDNLY